MSISTKKGYVESLREFRRQYWIALMDECGQSVAAAAKRAGTTRTATYAMLKKLGIATGVPNRGNAAWQALAAD